jgi:glycosyltransferase involved in cell wall biosynthesis
MNSMPEIHILSFEGPDSYSRAGGIASRVCGLANGLAERQLDTHLWFVGDPDLQGEEAQAGLTLHRWCQWISRYHPGGVYDGEEGKSRDFAASLPPLLLERIVPTIAAGRQVVILAEEWHTADAVLHLDWLLRQRGLRERVVILWNANNVFGFERIAWSQLARAAIVTTVSRYMRHQMWPLGVDAWVIPNGLPATAFESPSAEDLARIRQHCRGRVVLAKVARWDPDKRWSLAIETIGQMKRQGWRPLMIARGGCELHGREVLARARAGGLRVADRYLTAPTADALVRCVSDVDGIDIVNVGSHLNADTTRLLWRAADAVLANSGREPFGLVGLETMAAGGLACTGGTGEDYAVPGWNALVLQSTDPGEFLTLYHRLRANPRTHQLVRRRGRSTAERYRWSQVIERNLLPLIEFVFQQTRRSEKPAADVRVGP